MSHVTNGSFLWNRLFCTSDNLWQDHCTKTMFTFEFSWKINPAKTGPVADFYKRVFVGIYFYISTGGPTKPQEFWQNFRTGVLLPLPVQNLFSKHVFSDIWYRKTRVLNCENKCAFRYQISQNMCFDIILNWRVLIATCKQLVWSIRIGRNIPIWVLCTGSGRRTPALKFVKNFMVS